MTETELKLDIRHALTECGVWCFATPSGTARGRGGRVNMCPKGTPDIWTEYGWLEVKLPGKEKETGRLSDTVKAQIAFRIKAKERGINVAVVTSVSQAIQAVTEWKRKKEA